MNLFEIILLAFALSMDAFAVAVTSGIQLCEVKKSHYFRLGFHFGLFQFSMPVLGWYLGVSVRHYIEQWDHWAAFALLTVVGLNMIRESFEHEEVTADCAAKDPTKGLSLILLSVATSIDALAVGLLIAVVGQPIFLSATLIGVICCFVTVAGLYIGHLASNMAVIGKRAATVGGCVLIGIGIKILAEHGVFG